MQDCLLVSSNLTTFEVYGGKAENKKAFGRPGSKRNDAIEVREDVGRILLTRIGSSGVFC